MPLKITLKPQEKVLIGDAVITNGDRKSDFVVNNDVLILREKDILTDETANTPAKRVYFAVQLMYMKGSLTESTEYHSAFHSLLKDFMFACPSQANVCAEIGELVINEQFFKALKECKKLIKHEEYVLDQLSNGILET